MEERINEALQQIETDLQRIKSANEQVESVVNSYNELQEKVHTFVKDVSILSQETEKLIGGFSDERKKSVQDWQDTQRTLKQSCESIVSSLKAESFLIEDDFKKKTEKIE